MSVDGSEGLRSDNAICGHAKHFLNHLNSCSCSAHPGPIYADVRHSLTCYLIRLPGIPRVFREDVSPLLLSHVSKCGKRRFLALLLAVIYPNLVGHTLVRCASLVVSVVYIPSLPFEDEGYDLLNLRHTNIRSAVYACRSFLPHTTSSFALLVVRKFPPSGHPFQSQAQLSVCLSHGCA